MKEPTTKEDILIAIRSEWDTLQTTLDSLNEYQMLVAGLENDWSVKDILAHITAWESRMVEWIEASLRGETPDRPAPGEPWDDLDHINHQIYNQYKTAPLSEVLEQFQNVHQEAYNKVASLTEQDLLNPGRFAWRTGDPLWHMVADNTWWHYNEHHEAIQAWLKDA